MNVLVFGGGVYIGPHMCKFLIKCGNMVFVVDNFTTGFPLSLKYGQLSLGDIQDPDFLDEFFAAYSFDSVFHFAANSRVGESIVKPSKYCRNRVLGTLNLLDTMVRHDVNNFIFFSTAATFGNPQYVPIYENHPQVPIIPYGSSKLMVETILKDYVKAYSLNSVALRYFNACGADPEGELGECHELENHLIPIALQAASGRRKSITVLDQDYDTDDGTCVRDYIHIQDLCSAHGAAFAALIEGILVGAHGFNLGNGTGFLVQQVVDVVSEVVEEGGYSFVVEEGERSERAPPILVADSRHAREVLGLQPEYCELREIVPHAWAWEKKLVSMLSI